MQKEEGCGAGVMSWMYSGAQEERLALIRSIDSSQSSQKAVCGCRCWWVGRGGGRRPWKFCSAVEKEASAEREGNLTHTHRRRPCEGGTGSALEMLALKPAAVWPQAMGGLAKKLERQGVGSPLQPPEGAQCC